MTVIPDIWQPCVLLRMENRTKVQATLREFSEISKPCQKKTPFQNKKKKKKNAIDAERHNVVPLDCISAFLSLFSTTASPHDTTFFSRQDRTHPFFSTSHHPYKVVEGCNSPHSPTTRPPGQNRPIGAGLGASHPFSNVPPLHPVVVPLHTTTHGQTTNAFVSIRNFSSGLRARLTPKTTKKKVGKVFLGDP